MNIGEIGEGVRAAEETVDAAHAIVDVAGDRFAQARGLLHSVLATSGRPEALNAIEALTAAIARAEAAAAHCAGATTLLDEWLVTAGVPRRAGPPSGGGQSRTAADEPIPETVTRLAEGLQPWKPRTPVRARRLDGGDDADFVSGKDVKAAAGLRPEYAARVSVTDHAEGHLAERMRRPGARQHETLVVTKRPCPGDLGCDRTLPHIIPEGSTVTIYVVTLDGLRLWRTYRGTGEGIA